jgi:hypothetical protein
MVHAIRPGVRIKAVEVLLRNGAQEPFRLLEPTAWGGVENARNREGWGR